MARRKAKILGDWRDDAICIGRKDIDFFPERSHVEAAKAKAVCRECPVKEECLDEAIYNKEKFGVWGAMDTQERRKEARRRREEKDPLGE